MPIIEKVVKKAVNRSYFSDYMFTHMYSLSPYMGCAHGCTYCDGRAERYHLEGVFDKDIVVRKNIPDLLQATLPKLRETAPIHLSSGISDVYQQAEKKYNLTGRCSDLLSEYDFPVSVLTKSSLILRDIDNWIKVNKRSSFTLQMTLTTLDDKIRKKMEPHASAVEERLEVIKAFKDAGCNVGVYMMPLLPGITDDNKGIESTLEVLQELEVDYIIPWFVTLRPGRQKDFYLNGISKDYPELLPLYSDIYSENRVSGSSTLSYQNNFFSRIEHIFKGVDQLPPHRLYRGTMPIYCELIILLQHMLFLYSRKGIDVSKLDSGFRNLKIYLESEKKRFNRKRTLPENEIDNNLLFMIKTGDINSIIKNEKLSDFVTEVSINRRLFDYHTLKLIK